MATHDAIPLLPRRAALMGWSGVALGAGVLALELLAISLVYQHGFVFECRAVAPAALCGFLSAAVMRLLAALAVLAVVLAARPLARAALRDAVRPRPASAWLAAHGAGFALLLTPALFLRDGVGAFAVALGFALWLVGGGLAALGAGFAAVAPRGWLAAARAAGPTALAALVVALLSPDLARLLQSFWGWAPLTSATFAAAEALLGLVADGVVSVPAEVMLGVPEFVVLVGPQCSGVEGFALITGFLAFYMALFRATLSFSRALILFPLGLLASWVLNVVRIVALIQIGAHVSPELAVEGFHSHAGWLMFTVLSLSLITLAHATPWLRRRDGAQAARAAVRTAPPPLAQDWNAARLLPFTVFMASALVASTFFEVPGLFYPARFAATLAALLAFRALLRALDWRLDGTAVAVGLAVGVLWLATDAGPDAEGDALGAALAALPAWAFALWALTRVLGTFALVPVIEELLFRSYLQERLDPGGRYGWLVALAGATVLFAALHDRWLAAALAGVVFALAARRTGRLGSAIQSHMAANGLIAAWAVASGDWSAI